MDDSKENKPIQRSESSQPQAPAPEDMIKPLQGDLAYEVRKGGENSDQKK